MFKPKKQCLKCQAAKLCRDSALSWVFLFVGVIATISIRVVNLVLHFGVFWPKFFWYLGVAGFFLYFLYKFRQDRQLRRKLAEHQIQAKLSGSQPFTQQDKDFLNDMLCRMQSGKDGVNYFFIFASSAIVLLLAIYQDFWMS
jgi:hypothetical protein